MVAVPMIRRNHIINRLRRAGAVFPETAVTFEQAGVLNPQGFSGVTRMMLRKGILGRNERGYYLLKYR